MSLLHDAVRVESLTVLSRFRTDLYDCLTARPDALFELTDAVLCTDGPVRSLVELALAPEHRRGHGSLYDDLQVFVSGGSAELCQCGCHRVCAVQWGVSR
ncbi:transposase, partial [Streptomyces scopuliridis]|uniref:transposase n=1 Tax=Streptomyces scopuliridis TaxID=452529 RepID=UPI0036BBAFF0